MSYPEIFIRCRLRAVHPFDGLADEIGLHLDRADGGNPLRVMLCRAGALRLADQLRAYLAATPSEDSEIDAVVSALAALTDRVRVLEARAEPKVASQFSFGDDGKLYVSPAMIPKMRAAEQSAAAASVIDIDKVTIGQGPDWTATHDFASGETRFESRTADKPVPVASELYAEATRATTQPAANLLARIEALETAVANLQTSVAGLISEVGRTRSDICFVEKRASQLEAITNELRGRTGALEARHSGSALSAGRIYDQATDSVAGKSGGEA